MTLLFRRACLLVAITLSTVAGHTAEVLDYVRKDRSTINPREGNLDYDLAVRFMRSGILQTVGLAPGVKR